MVQVPRARIVEVGGNLMAPPNYFGVFLDIPPITVDSARVTERLGLALTPLEAGLRETFAWYARQPRVTRDYVWEDALMQGSRARGTRSAAGIDQLT